MVFCQLYRVGYWLLRNSTALGFLTHTLHRATTHPIRSHIFSTVSALTSPMFFFFSFISPEVIQSFHTRTRYRSTHRQWRDLNALYVWSTLTLFRMYLTCYGVATVYMQELCIRFTAGCYQILYPAASTASLCNLPLVQYVVLSVGLQRQSPIPSCKSPKFYK